MTFASFAQEKQVCFTIDDLPVVRYGNFDPFYSWDITLNIISTFDKYEIPAIGFVNEGQLLKDGVMDSSQLDVFKLWFQNGYEIGNHTYSHRSYHRSTLVEFKEEILKGEAISRHLEEEYNKELRYFRHPYLHIGETKEKYDSLNALLDSLEYMVAPITIINSDWVFANAYAKAEKNKDRDLMAQIGEAYVVFTKGSIELAEQQSEKLFGRQIRQTLLIHASKLNSDYLDELAELFTDMEYEFIDLDEALKDKAYRTEITTFKDGGSSWLESWAASQNITFEPQEDAAQIPEWIKNPK